MFAFGCWKIIKTGRKTGPTTLWHLGIYEVGPSLCTLHVAWPAAPSHRMKALEGTNVFGVQDLLDMFQPSAHCQKYDGAVTGDALCRDRVKHLRPQQNKAATGPTLWLFVLLSVCFNMFQLIHVILLYIAILICTETDIDLIHQLYLRYCCSLTIFELPRFPNLLGV